MIPQEALLPVSGQIGSNLIIFTYFDNLVIYVWHHAHVVQIETKFAYIVSKERMAWAI